MNRKKVISILLLVVFSAQILPVLQIGKMLYQNQLTEEIPYSNNSVPAPNAFEEEVHKAYWHEMEVFGLKLQSQIITNHIHETENIFTQYFAEVQTPPPNC
ncbi:MAG TPA: hypothetical protein VFN30_09630 [Chitinophagaceae bacterium]|nr:hypothetical protein [Chitinophagaceae bacterium]